MILPALLAILLLLAPPYPLEPQCETGLATRHDAFYSVVLQTKPERATPGVDGYIALESCQRMGERMTLIAGDYSFDVIVADCLAKKHRRDHDQLWGGEWLVDVDRKIWLEAGLPNKPTEVTLCEKKPRAITDLSK